jgi:DNA polymerase IV
MRISERRKSPEPLFAAVEVTHFQAQSLAAGNPALRGRPFAVIEQTAESHKTPVMSLSRAARQMGMTSGTPVFIARRRWPRVQILTRDISGEMRLRKDMGSLFQSYTPDCSAHGSGGFILNMMGTPVSRKMAAEAWGRTLRQNLLSLGLEAVSIGIAASRTVARVLARRHQPDGMGVCAWGQETAFLDPLSPELLPGLSPHCRELLRKYGLASIASVRNLEKKELTLRFGKEGEKLYTLGRGLDFETVTSKNVTIIVETILSQDLNDQEALRSQVRLTADKLGHSLRREGLKAEKVTLVLTYSDKRSVRKTADLPSPTAAFLALADKVVSMFEELYQRRVALRRIQLQVATPVTETGQIDLFDTDSIRKQESLASALDKIRVKRSFNAVLNGGMVKPAPELRPKRRIKSVKWSAKPGEVQTMESRNPACLMPQ